MTIMSKHSWVDYDSDPALDAPDRAQLVTVDPVGNFVVLTQHDGHPNCGITHAGQPVVVLGVAEDADEGMETLYQIQATDGWNGHAFESELLDDKP